MTSPPWMPFYPADYLATTGHFEVEHHGAYLMLIFHYWINGGLPSDDRSLARISRMTDRQWRAAKPIISEFFTAEWKHGRIEKELQKVTEKRAVLAANGSRGGNATNRAKPLKTKEPNAAIAPDLLQQNVQQSGDFASTRATITTINEEREDSYPVPVPVEAAREKTNAGARTGAEIVFSSTPENASQAGPPSSTAAVLEYAVTFLMKHGEPPDKARKIASLWFSQANNDPERVRQLIELAQAPTIRNPIGWVFSAIKEKTHVKSGYVDPFIAAAMRDVERLGGN